MLIQTDATVRSRDGLGMWLFFAIEKGWKVNDLS